MSRVIYTDLPATREQEALRVTHGVRLVAPAEEGNGLNALPGGVYGFTYSPALPNAPLFATRRYRSYETHRAASGDCFIIGFATADEASRIESTLEDLTLRIQPQPEGEATVLVTVPYARIRQHRQYAAPNQNGFMVTVAPAKQVVGSGT